MAIIVKTAHQTFGAHEGHARGLQSALDAFEKRPGLGSHIGVDARCVRDQRLVALRLGIENAQRVLFEPFAAFGAEHIKMLRKMRHQCRPPGAARFSIAQRIQLQHHPVGDPQLGKQLLRQRDDLDIGGRLARAEHFGIELVELAKPAFLRAFIAEQRPPGGNLDRGVLLPAILDIGAGDAGGEFRTQRQRVAAAILETIHFFRHDIGGFAQRARKYRRRLEHRHLDPAKAIKLAHPVEGFNNMVEARRLLADHVLSAAGFLD